MLRRGIPIAKHFRRELGTRTRVFSASFVEKRVSLGGVDPKWRKKQLDFARRQALELEQPLPASPRHRHHAVRCEEGHIGSEMTRHLLELHARDWLGA